MNNNIQEDYCSFEVSKLLKEKGFEISQEWYYVIREKTKGIIGESKVGDIRINTRSVSDVLFLDDDNYAWRPTHAIAIKWIRENFGIDFEILPKYKDLGKFYSSVIRINVDKIINLGSNFKSPEEATEIALKYTLENLI